MSKRPDGDGTVRKRADGRWEGRIVIGHKEDGAPIFKSVFAASQKELMPKLHAAIDAYRGAEITGPGMTLSDWMDIWFEEYAVPRLRPSTLSGYTNSINNHIRPALGGKKLGSLTRSDVQKFYNALKKKKARGNKTLSDSHVRGIHMLLHEILEAAVRERLIPKNPTDGTTVPKCNYPPMQVLNEEQLAANVKPPKKKTGPFGPILRQRRARSANPAPAGSIRSMTICLKAAIPPPTPRASAKSTPSTQKHGKNAKRCWKR
jgi:hypothetical protein